MFSGNSVPSFLQDFGYSAPLNKLEDIQPDINQRAFIYQVPFSSSGPFTETSSTYQISPSRSTTDPSGVESFLNELNSAVYTSKTLPDIFDLRELSPEAFSRSLYDYVYACAARVSHSDPHYIARMATDPLTEGIKTYTAPILLDIYANSIAKFLLSRDALNSYNAATLARKYAQIMEETSKRHWVKENPESKFLVLEEGFRNYMKSIGLLGVDTVEDLAVYFGNEVKRVAKNLIKNSQ